MLLANTAVAQQVAVHFTEQALLRRHDPPIERRLVSVAIPLNMARDAHTITERLRRARSTYGLQDGCLVACCAHEVAGGR